MNHFTESLHEDEDPILEKLRKIVIYRTSIPSSSVHLDSDFLEDLDADSIDKVEIIMEVEDSFKIEISDLQMQSMFTLRDLYTYVKKAVSK